MPPSRIGWPVRLPKPVSVMPPGPIVIPASPPPGTPPAPAPTPLPPQYQPGYWSDGWAVVRQHEGNLVLDVSNGVRMTWPIGQASASATAVINQALGVLGAPARATTVEPWPPARPTLAKASKGALMADITLADVLAQIQVLILNSEQVNTRLAAIEEHLAGAAAEQPPAPQPDASADVWDVVIAQTEPPAYVIEPQTAFDKERAISQAWWGYSPINGTRVVFPPVDEQRRQWLAEIWRAKKVSDLAPIQQRFWVLLEKYLAVDAAFYAVLTGVVNPFKWGELGSRDENEFVEIKGKTLEQLWHMSADVRTGGGRVSGDEG